MTERGKWLLHEEGKYFLLMSRPGSFCSGPGDGSLGRGTAEQTMRFQTFQEREYYINLDALRDELLHVHQELNWLKTVKGAIRNLQEVRAKRRKERQEREAYVEKVATGKSAAKKTKAKTGRKKTS
jgi:hypothetical protein